MNGEAPAKGGLLDDLFIEEDSLIKKLDQEEQDRRVREAVLSMMQPDQEIFLRHYYYCQTRL